MSGLRKAADARGCDLDALLADVETIIIQAPPSPPTRC